MRSRETQLQDWMVAGLNGDAAAHSMLLRSLVPILHAYYRHRNGHAGEMDDLVQETLIAIHARRESYDRDRPFAPWLFAVARYKMIDYFRRYRPSVPISDFEATLGVESFEDASNGFVA